MKTNTDTVAQIYADFGQGNIPAILKQLADDVQWEAWADNSAQQHDVPWLKPRFGKDNVPGFFQVVGQMTFIRFEVLSMMSGGNQVAVELSIETAPSAISLGIADEEIHLWTFNEEGKVIRFRHYADTYKHIQAASVHTPQPVS
ncbi:hypothetical protein GCM10023187_26070 [Nibrella viscosa]|uniref:SnoaL-like domain-containing protein n=1 Tax=Nibrella viscosa TaxID=1084524 RepID=A0ABP8KHW1_9BACT